MQSNKLRSLFIVTALVTVMLSGCGASQPPVGAPGAMPQTSAIAMLAPCSGSNSTNGAVPLTRTLSNRSTFPRASDARNATSGSKTFYYTGAEQSFNVPSSVTSINVVADGAAGADERYGRGGRTQATIPVTPDETLYVFVGGQGSIGSGGFNGGGGVPSSGGYGGGGASDVREGGGTLSDRILVAGAGAGGGAGALGAGGPPAWPGGAGGGTAGEKGRHGTPKAGGGGGGGNQRQGGAGGAGGDTGGYSGSSGAFGAGGTGGLNGGYSSRSRGNGGGGGGGYYGGGGGGGGGGESCGPAFPGGGGGGGSSYVESSASGVKMYQGWKHDIGDGQVVFSW